MNTRGERYFVRKLTTRAIVVPALAIAMTATANAQVSFEGLGDLPGGTVSSYAQAISSDGTTVVGNSTTDAGQRAFRWTESTAMGDLGSLSGASGESFAYGVSADGSVIVGQSDDPGFARRAFRWTDSLGMTGLDDLAGGNSNCIAYSVSGDGSVIVGMGRSGTVDEAVQWVNSPTPERIHIYSGLYSYSGAIAVSGDGAVVAGVGNSPDNPGYQAFIWLGGGGMDLGVLPGAYSYSFAYDLSDAGDVAVGWSLDSTFNIRPFRWDIDNGMTAIPGLPQEYMGIARGVSADGSIVVGSDYTDSGQFAFLWTEESGTVAINDFLSANGVEPLGWKLTEAVGISADGACIVGNGFNPAGRPEAWLVRIVVNLDSDGDGINDDIDAFPNSDVSPTLVLGGQNTDVPNLVFPDGSTMADQISMIALQSSNHGGFSSEVSHLTNDWAKSGLITKQDKGTIQKAVAAANIP